MATLLEKLRELAVPRRPQGGVVELLTEGDGDAPTYLDLATGEVSLNPLAPTCIVRAYARDYDALLERRMSPEAALNVGRLRVTGDAAQLAHLFAALRGEKA